MSTILDALQKAQRERDAERPGMPQHAAVTASSHRPTLLVGGIIAIALLLIAGALWRIAARTPTASTAMPAPHRLAAVQPGLPAAVIPATGQTPGATPPPMHAGVADPATDSATDPLTSPIAQVAAVPVAEPVGDGVEDGVEAMDASAADADATAAMHYQSLDDVTPVYRSSEADSEAVSEGVSDPAVSAGPQTPASATPLPDATETHTLPADIPPRWNASRHPQLASLTLQVHVYDADPARRWVMIDGRRYNEGSNLPSGATLTEIRADGLIFRIDGESVWWPLTQ